MRSSPDTLFAFLRGRLCCEKRPLGGCVFARLLGGLILLLHRQLFAISSLPTSKLPHVVAASGKRADAASVVVPVVNPMRYAIPSCLRWTLLSMPCVMLLKAVLREDHREPTRERGWRRFPAPEELSYSLDYWRRPLYPSLLSSVWIRKIIADKVVVPFVYWLLCQSASTHSLCGAVLT